LEQYYSVRFVFPKRANAVVGVMVGIKTVERV